MVKIKNIFLISKEAKEAEVILTDGEYELICFCQPCKKKIGEEILEELYCFNNNSVIKAKESFYAIEKMCDPFSYYLTGKLYKKNEGIVQIGDFLLQLEENTIPNDIKESDYVTFSVARIDLY